MGFVTCENRRAARANADAEEIGTRSGIYAG